MALSCENKMPARVLSKHTAYRLYLYKEAATVNIIFKQQLESHRWLDFPHTTNDERI